MLLPRGSPARGNLHSFPTRRSSDLQRRRPACAIQESLFADVARQMRHRLGIEGVAPAVDGGRSRFRRMADDSRDRKSTRLNSSHLGISYAVFCLKKKKNTIQLLP